MKSVSLLILLLCAPLFSMEEDNKNVLKSFEPNLMWLDTVLKNLGNCGNLMKTSSKWNKFCNQYFDELHQPYIQANPWKLVRNVDHKYRFEIVQKRDSPHRGLWMYHLQSQQLEKAFVLYPKKTIVSFHFENRDYALTSINPYWGKSIEWEIKYNYETIDKGTLEKIGMVHRVSHLMMGSVFFVHQWPLRFALKVVNHNANKRNPSLNSNDITDAFLEANTEPKFHPEFAQTLLSQQKIHDENKYGDIHPALSDGMKRYGE